MRSLFSSAYSTSSLQVRELCRAPEIEQAFRFIDDTNHKFLDELIRICEIAAPPFKESLRAEYVRDRFQEMAFGRVRIDDEGNVIATRQGVSSQPGVIISAHLDTVFPENTDVRVRREGQRLLAPGIGDNTCGVASLLALARAMEAGAIKTSSPVHFVATVGEEGAGDLRGVRYLFSEGDFRSGADAFVSLDGPGLERITSRALGSRRYRVTITGPGGHSWGDFGIVNPVHALGRAIARFAAYAAPFSPRTSYSVSVIEGGSSVNAIPESASMTVDMRSVSSVEIDKLETHLRRVVELAAREENLQRATSGTSLSYQFEMVGDRPSGETPVESNIVQTALECSRALGIEPKLDCSSTDSNIPISLHIPAITLGAGGAAANCHTLAEWYEPAGNDLGLKRVLLLTVALAGLGSK